MNRLFFKSLQRYGEYEKFSSDSKSVADTGARIKISKKGMQAYCNMVNVPYKNGMENNHKIVITIDEQGDLYFDETEGKDER